MSYYAGIVVGLLCLVLSSYRLEIVTSLNYLSLEKEMEIILAKNKSLNNQKGKEKIANMINIERI